jgi:hypothetical protein
MIDYILILLSGLIVASVLCPFAEAYSKWKKEMECDEYANDDR